ncbi:hypothetical protein SRIMM317S_06833 [Streptomyces rimosus subsp. rimosus]
MLGAKAFAASPTAAGVDGVIVCEPEGYEVCTSARGGIRLRFALHGVMAHGAMPQEGRNPLVAGARVVAALAGAERMGRTPVRHPSARRDGDRHPDGAARRRP